MKEKIIEYLKQHKSVKRRDLLAYLRGLSFVLSDRAMRSEIEEIVRQGGLIESSEKGYSLISSIEDLNRAVAYLESKAEAIAWRKNQLIHNFREKQKDLAISEIPQLELFR